MSQSPKQTFAALDGVRGIAALAVMMFHIAWWPHFGRPFPSAYLAVDLFFALSGFVVAHAYSPRLSQGMSPWGFLRLRVVRLWPLYALGLAVGVAAVIGFRLAHDQAVGAPSLAKHLGFHLLFLPLLIGGAMTACTLTGRRLLEGLIADEDLIEARLSLGDSIRAALAPTVRQAIRTGLVPAIDQTRNVGIVTLPGTFVGLVLGGASPAEAARIQLTVLLTLLAVELLAATAIAELIVRTRIAPGERLREDVVDVRR